VLVLTEDDELNDQEHSRRCYIPLNAETADLSPSGTLSETADLSPSGTLCATKSRLGQLSKGPSNAFEPGGDRLSNLVGTVLLHEVGTSDDAVLIREAGR
jgi:hypothetical protein